MSVDHSLALLSEIAEAAWPLSVERVERGMVHGRRTSTPASRRSLVDLDVLDAQRDFEATLRRWAHRIIRHNPRLLADRRMPSSAELLRTHWGWAVAQEWGPAMVADLEALRDRLADVGHDVRVIDCPVCHRPTRLDRLVTEHRACLAEVPLEQ